MVRSASCASRIMGLRAVRVAILRDAHTDLILRSLRSKRLEGWRQRRDSRPSFETRARGALLRMRSVFFTGSKAGDPVFRDINDGVERPQRTGYPDGACHRARRRRDPVAEYDGLCEAAPVFALSKFEIRHVGRRSPGRRGSFATQHSRCEFGFCRKGFAPTPEIQLAVGQQPVYNPALRCFR